MTSVDTITAVFRDPPFLYFAFDHLCFFARVDSFFAITSPDSYTLASSSIAAIAVRTFLRHAYFGSALSYVFLDIQSFAAAFFNNPLVLAT